VVELFPLLEEVEVVESFHLLVEVEEEKTFRPRHHSWPR